MQARSCGVATTGGIDDSRLDGGGGARHGRPPRREASCAALLNRDLGEEKPRNQPVLTGSGNCDGECIDDSADAPGINTVDRGNFADGEGTGARFTQARLAVRFWR